MSELMALRRLAARGRGVTACLSGPAGIGKSYRANAFLSSLPCRSLHVLADAPAANIFRMVPALPREPEWVSNVIRRQERGETVPAQQLATALHARLNLHVPVVLLVDHLHRCTPAQLEFWQALGELVRGSKGVGLLGLTRTQAPAGWAEVSVEPLYRAESDALTEVTLGSKAPQPFLDWLYDRAQGHPLYTLELIRHAQRQGAVQILDGQARWKRPERESLPPTLEGLVRSLLPPHLSEESWRVLAELLLTNQPPQATPEVLKQLEDLGLCEDGQLSHPLYREALLPLMPPSLLGTILEELSARGRLGNPLQAAQLLSRVDLPLHTAHCILKAGAQHAELLEDWATAASLWEKASQPLQAARCWCETTGERAQARKHLRVLLQQGDLEWGEFATLWAKAGEGLDELLSAVPASLHSEMTEKFRWAEFDGANKEKTLRLWEALSPDLQERAGASVLNNVGRDYFFQKHDLKLAEELLNRARQLNDPQLQSVVLGNLGLIPLYRGDNLAALAYFEQALQHLPVISSEKKRRDRESVTLYNISMCLSNLGRNEEALELAQKLADQAYADGDIIDYADNLLRVGQYLMSLGQFQEANDVFMRSYDILRSSDVAVKQKLYSYLIPLHFHWMSEPSPILLAHYVTELEGLILSHPTYPWLQAYFLLALGLAACGQPDAAEHYLEKGLELSRQNKVRQGLRYGRWVRSVILAERGEWGAAAEALKTESEEGSEEDRLLNLWAAYYRGDTAELERLSAAELATGDALEVHSVNLRWQQREIISSPLAQPVAALPHLHVLGDIRMYQPDGAPFKSRSGAHLLVLLLCARLTGEDGLSQTELAEELFPERDEPNALRALRRLLTRLREVLGPGVVRQSGERLLLGDIQSDAELFLQTQEPELWRGLFLNDDLGGEFTDAARTLLLTRLEGLVGAFLDTDPEAAERLAALLCRHEPYEKRLLALQLRAHDAANHPRQAGAAYRRAREHYAEVGETLPDNWQTFLAKESGTAAMPALVALSGGPAQGTVSAARQARALQVHRSTISRWQKGEVQRPGQRGRAPQLSDEVLAQVRGAMAAPREDGQAWTLAVIADYVLERYDVRLSRSQLSRLLRQER